MEHMLCPPDAISTEWDTVPWLGRMQDEGPFDEYLFRHVVPGVELVRRKPPMYSVKKPYRYVYGFALEEVFQDWLFFGMLREFFGKDFDAAEFITYDGFYPNDRILICTSRLPSLLDTWMQTHSGWVAYKSEGIIRNIPDEIVRLRSSLNSTCPLLWAVKDSSFDSRVRLSILSTMELLWGALKQCYGDLIGEPVFSAEGQCDSLRDQEMMRQGWCPFLIFQMRFRYSTVSALYFTSRLQMPSNPRDHERCSKRGCKRSSVAYEQLEKDGLLHRADCKGCSERGVEGDEVTRMITLLKEGTFPLIRFSWRSDEHFSLEIVPFTGRQRYVAISHVWADGLGNPFANTLRKCQLTHVLKLIWNFVKSRSSFKKTERTFYYWLDTLCCPVSDKEARAKAITLMHETYSKAYYVLILDADLKRKTMTSTSDMELAACILSCGWARRLWTFKESVSAQRPWVQFADGVRDLHGLARNVEMIARSVQEHDLRQIVLAAGLFRALWGLLNPGKQFTLSRVVRGVEDRLVSKNPDEPLCIALLLDLDIEPIVQTEGFERIKTFWECMAKSKHGIPKNIIFVQTQKLPLLGYRWAPITLRHRMTWQFASSTAKDQAELKHDGLYVILPGGTFIPTATLPQSINSARLLSRSGHRNPDQILLVDKIGRWWELRSLCRQ